MRYKKIREFLFKIYQILADVDVLCNFFYKELGTNLVITDRQGR